MMDWDKRYRDQDIPWDKGAPAPILERLLNGSSPDGFPKLAQKTEVLVPGCGLGHDVRFIAAAGYRVTGCDISTTAIEAARCLDREAGVESVYIVENIFDPISPQVKLYDVIWEHTCYCAIEPARRNEYVQAVYDCLKPGGVLLGVFFVAPQSKLGPPHMTTEADLRSVFSSHFDLLWERAPELYYPARKDMEWLMCWRKKLTI